MVGRLLSFWVSTYFQGRTVSFRECKYSLHGASGVQWFGARFSFTVRLAKRTTCAFRRCCFCRKSFRDEVFCRNFITAPRFNVISLEELPSQKDGTSNLPACFLLGTILNFRDVT